MTRRSAYLHTKSPEFNRVYVAYKHPVETYSYDIGGACGARAGGCGRTEWVGESRDVAE